MRPSRGQVLLFLSFLVLLQGLLDALEWKRSVVLQDGDPCWYYVVARNVAVGRGLQDTILWNYLGNPNSVQRPAGTYWSVGWPVFLGSCMRVLGHSASTACFITGVLSLLVPLLVVALAWMLTQDVAVAACAGVLDALQLRMLRENVFPDVTVSYQIAVLVGMLAMFWLFRRPTGTRGFLSGVLFALPVYLRMEGFIVLGVGLSMAVVYRVGIRPAVWLLAGVALALTPYVLYYASHFGTLVPLPRALLPYTLHYEDLFAYPCPVTAERWHQAGAGAAVASRLRALWFHLRLLLVDAPVGLLPVALAGLVAARRRAMWVPAAFLLLSWIVPPMCVPHVANPNRLLAHATPLLCMLAAVAIVWVDRRGWRVVALALGTMCLTCNPRVLTLESPPPYLRTGAFRPSLSPQDVVLTDDSWRLAACLDVPTLQAPYPNSGLPAVLVGFRPRYVVAWEGSYLLTGLNSLYPSPFKILSSQQGLTWYELRWPARNSDGSPARRP